MNKRLVAAVLCMGLVLTGCGATGSTAPVDNSNQAGSEQAEADIAETEPVTEALLQLFILRM